MRYVLIHPHQSGNGRVARSIMNLILMSAGIEPVVFFSSNQYLQQCALSRPKENNLYLEHILRHNSGINSVEYMVFENFLRNLIKVQGENKDFLNDLINDLSNCETRCQELLDSYLTAKTEI